MESIMIKNTIYKAKKGSKKEKTERFRLIKFLSLQT